MRIENLIDNQVEFRNRIDLLALDFQLIIMNYIKRLTKQPSIMDNERRTSLQNNVQYCINALQAIQEELNINIAMNQVQSEENVIKN